MHIADANKMFEKKTFLISVRKRHFYETEIFCSAIVDISSECQQQNGGFPY